MLDPSAFLSLPFPNRQVLLWTVFELVGGLCLLATGLYCGSWINLWSENFGPTGSWTVKQFKGALLYTFIYPLGFLLTLDSISRLATFRGLPRLIRIALLVLFGIVCLIGGILGLASWNGKDYFDLTPDNVLYESLFGFELVWTWVPIAVTVFYIIVVYVFNDYFETRMVVNEDRAGYERFRDSGVFNSPGAAGPGAVPASGGEMSRGSMRDARLPSKSMIYRVSMLVFVLVFLIPGLWWSTTFLPGDWHQSYTSSIASSTKPSPSEWTILKSIDFGSGKRWMHIYFDVLIYYVGIIATLTLGLCVRACEHAQMWLSELPAKRLVEFSKTLRKEMFVFPLWFPTYCKNGVACRFNQQWVGLTPLQIIVATIWLVISWLIFYMFYWHHVFTGMSTGLMDEDLEQATRTVGILATMYLGLALIPVTRGNFINRYCLGLSFESAVKYHRFLGSLMGICGLFHSFGWLINFKKAGYLDAPYNYYPLSWGPWDNYHSDNFSLPLMWYVMLVCFLGLFLLSWITDIRRHFFQLWYACHVYLALVLVVGLMFHATNGWYFMIPGVALQFYERLYRLYATSHEHSIRYLEATGDGDRTGATRLVLNTQNTFPETPLGAYYFLNVPNISPFEWHPFSVSNALDSNKIEFYIRRSGDWSGKLNELALKASSSSANSLSNITVNAEGPYGTGLNYDNYDSLILIAGGIGITPFHNIFFTLYNEAMRGWKNRIPYVHLIWVVRYAEMFELYSETFGQFAEFPAQNMRIDLFASQGHRGGNRKLSDATEVTVQSVQPIRDDNIDCQIEWKVGRPNLEHELHFLAGKRGGALVYACGPDSLVTAARRLAYKHGNNFRMETFKM